MMTKKPWQMLLANGAELRRAGQIPEAIEAYRSLLLVKPELAESWYNLAWLQRQARQFTDALSSYGEALVQGVSNPHEVHLNRAVIYSDHLHQYSNAKRELGAALAIAPDYVPALLNLGNIHEDEGNRSAALDAYRRALQADPSNALTLARLAGATVADGPDDPLIGEVRTRLSRVPQESADAADLGFALGRMLDKVGDYDAAFAAYARANRASRSSRGNMFPDYDPADKERFVDRIITTFSEHAPERGGAESRVPLFICGMFRSGSTLVELILSGHSDIAAGGELDLLPNIIQEKLQPYPEAAAQLAPALLDESRRLYLEAIDHIAPDAPIITDKRPDNLLHIGLIKRLFPSARIIRTHRNPLDNILSLYFLHLDPAMAYALDLEHAAHWYTQQERLAAHWKRLYPADILDVDYDELVRCPAPLIRAMADFCGVGWEASMLDFNATRGTVKTASVWQVREPLYQRSSGRWRNYEQQLTNVFPGLADGQFRSS